MPVIPFSQSSQIMNPGSPVPIASGSRATVMAGAVEGFGKALEQVGTALNQAGREAAAKKQKLDIEEANISFLEKAEEVRQNRAGIPLIPDDPDGRKTRAAYMEDLKPVLDEIASNIADPVARRAFQVQARERQLQLGLQVTADDVKRRTEQNRNQMGIIINKYANQARVNPEEVGFAMGNAELLIKTDEDLLPEAKDTIIRAAKADIVKSGYNGILERAGRGQGKFEDAIKYLDKHGENLDPDDVTKLREGAYAAELRFEQREMQAISRQDAFDARQAKKVEKQNVAKYMAAIRTGSPEEVLAAQGILQMQVDAGEVSEQTFEKLINSKTGQAQINSAFVSDLVQKLVEGDMTPEQIDERVEAAPLGAGLDMAQAAAMRGGLAVFAQNMSANPEYASKVKEAVGQIEALATMPLAGASPQQLYAHKANVNGMKTQFYAGMAKSFNPDLDPREMAKVIIQKGGYGELLSGSTSPETLGQKMNDLYLAEKAREEQGLSTKDTRKVFRIQMEKLRAQKQRATMNKGGQ